MITARNSVEDVTISAVIVKADGTIVDLGEIAKTKQTILGRLKRWLIRFM
ncbi:MAG TPA: hypothetical protein PK033_15410 [Acetivibrio sp.]|jgi:hypothetical protein|nr:hypothetical protein [Acetivibrio sp.]